MNRYKQIEKLENTLGIKLNKVFSESTIPSNSVLFDNNREVIEIKLENKSLKKSDLEIITEFKWLKKAYLRNCSIGEIPASLFEHPNLEYIDLSTNKIDSFPLLRITNLQLKHIDLTNNKIKIFPSSLSKLTNLKTLILNLNKIESIPLNIGLFEHLKTLSLTSNNILGIPQEISDLKELINLDLTSNPIDELPDLVIEMPISITWESLKTGINLLNTSIEKPPPEIIEKGINEIKNYLQDSNREETKSLNEAKIIFVGNGGAGKTSLVKLLKGEKFDINESQTHGINVDSMNFNIYNKSVRTNIWDFGGQEIMHATHQVFLSRRSIYVLILNAREKGNEEYWLKQIQSFGGDSRIIIVINKIDENPSYEVNREYLKRKYRNISGFIRVSCLRGEGISDFRSVLLNAINQTDLIKTNWPLTWFNVKTEIEKRNSDFIEIAEFRNICTKFGINKETKQNTLVGFLNDLGSVVYFNDLSLNDLQVLNPEWITEGIYKIINSDISALNNGNLSIEDIGFILDKIEYMNYPKDKQKYLIEIMKKFQICYNINQSSILIPDLLSVQEPSFDFDFDNSNRVVIDYGSYLPRSIFPRFVIQTHTDVKEKLLWRTGVILQNKTSVNNEQFVIIVNYEENNINIFFKGDSYNPYLNIVILKVFQSINSSFEKLEIDFKLFLKDINQLVSIESLRKKYNEKFTTYLPENADKVYNLRKLLMVFEAFDEDDVNRLIVPKQPLFGKYKSEIDIIKFKKKLKSIENRYLFRNRRWRYLLKIFWKKLKFIYKVLIIVFALSGGILGLIELYKLFFFNNNNQENENEHKIELVTKTTHNTLYMAGGGFSGLTSQTSCPLSCGSDTPDCIGTARPHTSDRCVQAEK